MANSTEEYYQNPMRVKQPWWGSFIDRIVKNYTRTEVGAGLKITGDTCLDIACGDGELLNKYLYREYRRLVGVDISKDAIKIAKQRSRGNCRFEVADISDFIGSEVKERHKYDSIYMLAFLEHIQWPLFLLKELVKVVSKHGRIIIEVPNVGWLPHRLSLLFGRFPETAPSLGVIPGVHDEHIRFYTVDTLDALLLKVGFRRERLECSGRLRFIKKIWINFLSPDMVCVYVKK